MDADGTQNGYDLEITRAINGRPAWPSRIHKLTRLGGLVRLELTLDDGTNLLVQLTREQCLELALVEGENVYVTPKDVKVFHEASSFVENYSI